MGTSSCLRLDVCEQPKVVHLRSTADNLKPPRMRCRPRRRSTLDQVYKQKEESMRSRTAQGAVFDAFLKPNIQQLSAEDFLQMSGRSADEIKKARFVPPKIGEQGFGFFEVETRSKRFEVASCE